MSDVLQTINSLNQLQKESGAPFSVYGSAVPMLLISVLKTAISRKIGAVEHLDEFLNVSNGLNTPIPCLHKEDVMPILDSVCEAIGEGADIKGAIGNFFRTSILAFDDIANDINPVRPRFDLLLRDVDWTDTAQLFEKAIGFISEFSFRAGEVVSNPSLARLAKSLLNVREEEAFSDFVCGLGLSSAIILGDTPNVSVSLSDIMVDSFAVASLGCFLQGRKNDGRLQDALCAANFKDISPSDKIFIDPPLRARLNQSFEYDGIQIKESSCAAIMKAVSSLKENGIAVVAINSGFTYGSQFAFGNIREYLVNNNLLSAVVSLPAMWARTSILTTILVISKRENREIAMIDLSKKVNDPSLFTYDRKIQSLVMTNDAIERISSMIGTREKIPGICRGVTPETVRNNGYLLLPNSYVVDEEGTKKTIEEIDETIKKTLDEIHSLLKELK